MFDDEPEAFPIENPDPELCPFCGGNPHVREKKLWERRSYAGGLIPKVTTRRSVYVYCGRCRARGPIVARTLKRRSEEDEMKVEAIRKWNEMRGRR